MKAYELVNKIYFVLYTYASLRERVYKQHCSFLDYMDIDVVEAVTHHLNISERP